MTSDRIRKWARAGESEQMEFKASTGQRRAAARTLCAMLNRHGGQVVFGVEDGGNVVGQQIGQDTLGDLQREFGTIEPPVFPSLSTIEVRRGRSVVVASVPSGHSKPYSHRGTPYHRVGNTTVRMAGEEYQRILLERLHAQTRWENQPATGWSFADLDHDHLAQTVDEAVRRGRMSDPGSRCPADLLHGFNLLLSNGGLTRAAVVLFGRSPRLEAEYGQCLLRVARFRGTTRTEFLDNRQFHGHAFELHRLASRFFMETVPIAGRVLPGVIERVERAHVPGRGTPRGHRECDLSS